MTPTNEPPGPDGKPLGADTPALVKMAKDGSSGIIRDWDRDKGEWGAPLKPEKMMQKYKIPVTRGTTATREFEVEAETLEAARDKALDAAADYDWTGLVKEAEYTVDEDLFLTADDLTFVTAMFRDALPVNPYPFLDAIKRFLQRGFPVQGFHIKSLLWTYAGAAFKHGTHQLQFDLEANRFEVLAKPPSVSFTKDGLVAALIRVQEKILAAHPFEKDEIYQQAARVLILAAYTYPGMLVMSEEWANLFSEAKEQDLIP